MRRLSGTQLRLFAALGVAVLILVYSATATRRPPRAQPETTETRRAKRVKAEKAPVLRAAAPADADFKRYEMIASRDIFSAPKPPEPKPSATQGIPPIGSAKPNLQPVQPPQPVVAKPAAPPPLTGWSYVGCVAFGGRKLGIMQSDSASTTQDVEVGAQFQGYKVESIAGDQIVLASGVSKQILKRPPDFQITPLGGSVPEAKQRGQS